jgi:hypothetical protein
MKLLIIVAGGKNNLIKISRINELHISKGDKLECKIHSSPSKIFTGICHVLL